MSGRRVQAILSCAGPCRRIMTCGLSSLHLPVRRWGGRVDDGDILTLEHLSEIQLVVTKQVTINVSMEESKQNGTCTEVPVRKRSGTITTCRTRSRIGCFKITKEYCRGTCVHPKKRNRNDCYTKKGKKGQKRAKKKQENIEIRNKKLDGFAQRADRVPRGQGCCLLAQSVLRYV